jgi:peptidoglycan/LPS O-acetylase OafA/YrhL
VFIGLISYPLYLWHWPPLSFGRIIAEGEPTLQARAALVLAAVILAWATYRYVEAPVRGVASRAGDPERSSPVWQQ